MHAADGDRIIVASATLCAPAKDGEIFEVHGSNGEAPYLVRWSDTKRESLFSASHVTNWHTGLYLYEADEDTVAHAVLHGASQERLVSRGTTRNRAGEANVPEIGNEVAISTGLAESGRSATYDRIGRYVRSRRPSGSHRALRMSDI
jgi:hypothetical protein